MRTLGISENTQDNMPHSSTPELMSNLKNYKFVIGNRNFTGPIMELSNIPAQKDRISNLEYVEHFR